MSRSFSRKCKNQINAFPGSRTVKLDLLTEIRSEEMEKSTFDKVSHAVLKVLKKC